MAAPFRDGGPDPPIHVLILPARVMATVVRPGLLHPGDTLIADLDTSEANLPPGARLSVGSVVIEVSDVWNDGCVKCKVRYSRTAYDGIRAPAHQPLRLRGILCSIVEDGEVALGDPLRRV